MKDYHRGIGKHNIDQIRQGQTPSGDGFLETDPNGNDTAKTNLEILGENRFYWVKEEDTIYVTHEQWSTTGMGKTLDEAIKNLIKDALIIRDEYVNEDNENLTEEAIKLKLWLAPINANDLSSELVQNSKEKIGKALKRQKNRDDAKAMNVPYQYKIFEYFHNTHDLILTSGEISDMLHLFENIDRSRE